MKKSFLCTYVHTQCVGFDVFSFSHSKSLRTSSGYDVHFHGSFVWETEPNNRGGCVGR